MQQIQNKEVLQNGRSTPCSEVLNRATGIASEMGGSTALHCTSKGRKPKEKPENRVPIAGRINARPVVHNGKDCWRVIVPANLSSTGKPRRLHFDTATVAWMEADRIEATKFTAVATFAARPQVEQIAICHAADALGTRVLEIGEAVKQYLARERFKEAPLGIAVAACIAEKEWRKLSPSYLTGIRSTLERFANGREHMLVNQITPEQVRKWVARLPEAVSQRSELIDLRTLFSFAERTYGCVNVAKLVPFPKVIRKEPGILTIEQIRSMLAAIRKEHPHLMRYVALTLFAGVRPDEAKQLTADCVRDGYIVIPAAIVKGNRQRRLVRANETFLAWWNLGGKLPIGKRQVQKVHDLVQPWPADALRHSFCTYHSALFGEVATSTAAGHSIRVMEEHYKATVTRDDAERFWALRPNVQS
jgi:integrase